MPQAAAGFTPASEGGALVLPHGEHVPTRTYGWKGALAVKEDAELSFRQVLARDIRDVRKIVGKKYNKGLDNLTEYYRRRYPGLMEVN